VKRVAVAAVTCAAVLVAVLAFVRGGSSDPSLEAAPRSTTAPVTSAPSADPDPFGTIPSFGWLELDEHLALDDPCALLTDELRSAVGARAGTEDDGGRCEAATDGGVLAVEVWTEPAGPHAASSQFQVDHGDEVVPLDRAAFGLGFSQDQGDTTLVAVFADAVSIEFNLPVDDLRPEVLDMVAAALDPLRDS
jgi:hypothetical protein